MEEQITRSIELNRHLEVLEQVIEMLPVGIAISHDVDCRRMTANAAFSEMLGTKEGDNPSKTGESANDLPFRVMENGVEAPADQLPLQVAARTGVCISSRCEIHRHDGTKVTMQGRVVPLRDTDGRVRGSMGVFMDVTERENLIKELQHLQHQVKVLSGLLTICSSCKKIRDERQQWIQMETFIRDRSEAIFTHTYCPACADACLKGAPVGGSGDLRGDEAPSGPRHVLAAE